MPRQFNGERIISLTISLGQLWIYPHEKKKTIKLNFSYLTSYTKITLKWVIDLNVRAKTLKENMEVYIHDLELGNCF